MSQRLVSTVHLLVDVGKDGLTQLWIGTAMCTYPFPEVMSVRWDKLLGPAQVSGFWVYLRSAGLDPCDGLL